MFLVKKREYKIIYWIVIDEIFPIERKIGSGGFGSVYCGNTLNDNL
jgi:hypothetical protein